MKSMTTLLGAILSVLALDGLAQPAATAPLPDVRQLIEQVQTNQQQLDKARESYTFTSRQTGEDIDANGHVKKTQTNEYEVSFVNGHVIARAVMRDGKPLDDHDQQKETERVTKMVEKAEKTPQAQSPVNVSRILQIMDLRDERRLTLRGRPTVVFDFVGRKDAKTHGMIEDASKKLQGTVWIDEADRQVARLEVSFVDNFHVAGGLFANIENGSNFRFDQEPVNNDIWLPTGVESTMQARLLLVKNLRRHFVERDYDFKRFNVESEQSKGVQTSPKPH